MLHTEDPIDSYKYKITLIYLDKKKGKNITIRMERISSLAIDFDYAKNTMPVALVTAALDRKFRDGMLKDQDDNTVTLRVQKRCETGDKIWVDYIKTTEFKYFIDSEYNKRYDYKYQETDRDDEFVSTGIVMLPINPLKNNKKIKNTNIFDTDMSTIVANFTFPLGKMLMQPLGHNTHVSQIILPKNLSTIRQSLEYFNARVGAFYDSMYRFFIDYDQSYLIDSSGRAVVKKGEIITQVYIDVLELDDLHPTYEYGMATEYRKQRYYIPTGIQAVAISDPAYNISAQNYTKIVGIDADGNRVDYYIDITGKGNKTATKVINVDNNNLLFIKNLASQYKSSATTVHFSKNDLDSSVITMNKEYMLKFRGNNSNKTGRYILNRKREYYVQDDGKFRMSTTLSLNKVELV